VWSSVSAFNSRYLLLYSKLSSSCLPLLLHLPIPSTYTSVTCFRERILRKTWAIHLVFFFILLYVGCTLCHYCSWKMFIKERIIILMNHGRWSLHTDTSGSFSSRDWFNTRVWESIETSGSYETRVWWPVNEKVKLVSVYTTKWQRE